MRVIYLDSDFICYADYVEGRTAVETDALDHVCNAALCYYRFVPSGMSYRGKDHKIIGPFVQCIDSVRADATQAQYERDHAELQAAYQEGVNSAYD